MLEKLIWHKPIIFVCDHQGVQSCFIKILHSCLSCAIANGALILQINVCVELKKQEDNITGYVKCGALQRNFTSGKKEK